MNAPALTSRRDALLAELAALDDAYARGDGESTADEREYTERRAALKAELRAELETDALAATAGGR